MKKVQVTRDFAPINLGRPTFSGAVITHPNGDPITVTVNVPALEKGANLGVDTYSCLTQ